MLLELKVSNFAIIENIHLSFKKGFNIISGETGSGKSVLLKSLSLLMGGKSSVEIIRSGSDQAIVEGSFDISHRDDIKAKLESFGIETDDILVVRRIIIADKSRVYINGQISSLHLLKDLISPMVEVTGPSAPLIELTGQHENKNLLSPSYHLDRVDQFSGLWEKRSIFQQILEKRKHLESELAQIDTNGKDKEQRLDYLNFQKNEISSLDLNPGEDVALEQEIKKIKSSHKIVSAIQTVQDVLDTSEDSAMSRIKTALRKISELEQVDSKAHTLKSVLNESKSQMEDFLFQLQSYSEKMDDDSGRLDELESRLNRLRKLQKKYGAGIADILQSLVSIENEMIQLESQEQRRLHIIQEIKSLNEQLWSLADELHKGRVTGALKLKTAVNKELNDLNMKGVVFGISIQSIEHLNSYGNTELEFTTQTGPKDTPKSLSKFASGGELSRILLSLKKVMGQSDLPRTYLFDEVDTGVSGETAEKVGVKLKSIAKGQQVICVTHLPQVAAHGDHHYLIYKENSKDKTIMSVQELERADRIKELARLISGEKITKTSLAHAEELLTQSRSL